MLVEVLPSWRYRYRLIGRERQGAWHERHRSVSRRGTAWPGIQSACPRPLRRVRRARRPLYSECLFISLEQAPERHTKVLFLPLSDDGERVNQVLVVQVFFYIDPATRQRRFIEPRPFKEIAHLVFEVPSGVEMARR